MRLQRISFFVLIIVLLGTETGWAALFGTLGRDTKNQIESGLLNKTINIVPQINMLNAGFGNGRVGDFYFVKSVDKIFFQIKTVEARVTEIEFEDAEITLQLFNPTLGWGKVKFVFDEERLGKAGHEDITPILAGTLSDERYDYLFCANDSKMCHLHTCNHLPEADRLIRLKKNDKTLAGYGVCRFCFGRVSYIPDSSIEARLTEQQASRFPSYEPILNNPEKQKRIREAGQKVLKNWPFRLLGRNYSFVIIDSPKVNAAALPTGPVIIYSGLLDSLENEEELEAILVHEIAHIEKRHALRDYRLQMAGQQEMQGAAMMAGMAGAAAGAMAARNGRSGGRGGAVVVGSVAALATIAIMASHQNVYGYDKDLEREADLVTALYFDRYGLNKKNLKSVFKKMQFRILQTEFRPDSTGKSHPVLSERIDRAERTIFHHYNGKTFVAESARKHPVELNFYAQSLYKDENRMYAYVSDYALIDDDIRRMDNVPGSVDEDPIIIRFRIEDGNETQDFELIPRCTIRDTIGAHIVLEKFSQSESRFLKEPRNIKLNVNMVNTRRGARTYQFIFKEGKIDF